MKRRKVVIALLCGVTLSAANGNNEIGVADASEANIVMPNRVAHRTILMAALLHVPIVAASGSHDVGFWKTILCIRKLGNINLITLAAPN